MIIIIRLFTGPSMEHSRPDIVVAGSADMLVRNGRPTFRHLNHRVGVHQTVTVPMTHCEWEMFLK